MPVIRIEKNTNYTTMSNYHLRDQNLSLKAKGLLSLCLSLPEDWSYSINGLASICKEGRSGIASALKELEQYGYLLRERYRDEKGQLRDTAYLECMQLNAQCHKNQTYDEIKLHHYIISFDPDDKTENGLTGGKAQAIGMEFAKKNFPGHQAIVCTHMDGHNGSGNIHVHIVINSLRKLDVERQDFMERPCDSRAGYKHHQTRNYLTYMQKSLMEICQRENLHHVVTKVRL